MEVKAAIATRKSVRSYAAGRIARDDITEILKAGMAAPSGKNGQPWGFVVVQEDRKLLSAISKLTLYDFFVRNADCLILVFLDKTQSYHYVKDAQAAGACMQNMLLTAHDMGLGACWIGEILNRDTFVRDRLGLDCRYDLMGMIALGYPDGDTLPPRKKQLSDCLLRWD